MNHSTKLAMLTLLLLGCYRAPEVPGFESKAWTEAIENCTTYRQETSPTLIDQKELMLSLNQNQIIELLGLPDRQELSKRNRKHFFYQLECQSNKELNIRFNAVGLAKEIMITTRAN